MTLTTRVLTYLRKRNTWTPTDHLYRIAQNHGYHTLAIRDALDTIRNTCNIGYLYEKGYRWYDIPQEEQERMLAARAWFNSV